MNKLRNIEELQELSKNMLDSDGDEYVDNTINYISKILNNPSEKMLRNSKVVMVFADMSILKRIDSDVKFEFFKSLTPMNHGESRKVAIQKINDIVGIIKEYNYTVSIQNKIYQGSFDYEEDYYELEINWKN